MGKQETKKEKESGNKYEWEIINEKDVITFFKGDRISKVVAKKQLDML